jgi:hypothetical protein
VDLAGIEPATSSMPWKRAPSCATGPVFRDDKYPGSGYHKYFLPPAGLSQTCSSRKITIDVPELMIGSFRMGSNREKGRSTSANVRPRDASKGQSTAAIHAGTLVPHLHLLFWLADFLDRGRDNRGLVFRMTKLQVHASSDEVPLQH